MKLTKSSPEFEIRENFLICTLRTNWSSVFWLVLVNSFVCYVLNYLLSLLTYSDYHHHHHHHHHHVLWLISCGLFPPNPRAWGDARSIPWSLPSSSMVLAHTIQMRYSLTHWDLSRGNELDPHQTKLPLPHFLHPLVR